MSTGTTTAITQEIVLYWIPGCGNCTRLKGYLGAHGVDYRAVNVMDNLEAFEEMQQRGIATMPVVRRGDRWENGFDLKRIDALLGFNTETDERARALASHELASRAANILAVAAHNAGLVPLAHQDDPTPTMKGFVAPFLFMKDGTPWIPHFSNKSLIFHIAGHAEKLRRLALAADGSHELGFSVTFDGESAAFGEADLHTPLYRVVAQLELLAKDIRAWGAAHPDADLSRPVDTHYGVQTTGQLMQTNLCSIAQHTRQLTQRVSMLGVDPPAMVNDDDLEGLQMPAGIWE